MLDILKYLLETYPWIVTPFVYGTSAITVVIVVLGAIASLQGRQFKVGPITIGEKPALPTPSVSPTTVNVHPEFTPEHLEEIADKLAERVQELYTEEGELEESMSNKESSVIGKVDGILELMPNAYIPPDPPEAYTYAFHAKLAVEDLLRDIVNAWGGSWAGVSLAKGTKFFELATGHHIVDDQLAEDLKTFYESTEPFLAGVEAYQFDDSFESLVALTTHIVNRLEDVKQRMERRY